MYEPKKRFLQYLEIEKNYSGHTVNAYERDINQFEDFIRTDFDLTDLLLVQKRHIRLWISYLDSKSISVTSINRKIASLRSLYKFLFLRSYVTTNPTNGLVSPKKAKKLPEHLSKDEITRLFDSQDDVTPWGIQVRCILELFYGCGIRLSELVGLDKHHIDLQNHQIKILGKGNKERIVLFGEKAKKAINAHLENHEKLNPENSSALFITKKGKRMYPREVQRIVKKQLAHHSDIKQKSPHVLRHSFATHLLDNGAEITAIKELLGHSNLAATQVYTHTSVDRLKKIYDTAHPRAQIANINNKQEKS